MKKILILSSTLFFLAACASAPDPISWQRDLDNLPTEPINDRVQMQEIYKELDNKSVWR